MTTDLRPAPAIRPRLRRVDATAWVIEDRMRSRTDPARMLGRIVEVDETCVEVTWLAPFPLPTRYLSAADALEDLERWRTRSDPSDRPVPIPHLPPLHNV